MRIAFINIILLGTYSSIYVLYILMLLFARFFIKDVDRPLVLPRTRFGIVIPAHDEELFLARLLKTLNNQYYPSDMFKIVVVGTFGCGLFYSPITFATVTDGTWHSLETIRKLNDPGQANGIYEIWIDGGANGHWLKTNADYSPATSDTWFTSMYAAGLGIGNYSDERWNMSDWTGVGFDDFVISTDYVGPIGGPIKKDAPPAPPTGLKVVP